MIKELIENVKKYFFKLFLKKIKSNVSSENNNVNTSQNRGEDGKNDGYVKLVQKLELENRTLKKERDSFFTKNFDDSVIFYFF